MEDENKIYGGLRAIVKDVDDPEKIGRVRVFIPALMSASPDSDRQWSNWCEPKFVKGGADGLEDRGSIVVPPVGSRVWVEFEMGDPDYPVYSGGFYQDGAGGTPPVISKGENDNLPPTDSVVGGVTIPGPRANTPEYPKNVVYKSARGITIEIDDTAAGGRVRVQMPKFGGEATPGAFIELTPDGKIVLRGAIRGGGFGEQHLAGTSVVLGVSSGKVYAGSTTAAYNAVIDNQFLSNLDTLLSLLSTWAAAVDVAIPLGAAPVPPSATLATAISTFSGALAGYRATKLNAE